MHLHSLVLLIPTLSLLVSAIPTVRRDTTLATRACVKNGCECARGTKQGQYCGVGGIYECNPAAGCCFYGFSESCKGFTYGEKQPTIGPPKVGL